MKFLHCLVLFSLISSKSVFAQYQPQHGDRVAPGIPPQHYQYQQPPEQQNQQYQHQDQQQQQQYQQEQLQQQQYQQEQQQAQAQYAQQLAQQQQQQQQQYQQVVQPQQPVGHEQQAQPLIHAGHAHIRPQGQVFDTSNIAMEREHLQEHMDLPIDTSQMSEDELMFHNFKMWDGDNDNMVDGLDLLKYLMEHLGGEDPNTATKYVDEQFADIVDQIMNNMDVNKDGITTFSEYMQTSKGYNQI